MVNLDALITQAGGNLPNVRVAAVNEILDAVMSDVDISSAIAVLGSALAYPDCRTNAAFAILCHALRGKDISAAKDALEKALKENLSAEQKNDIASCLSIMYGPSKNPLLSSKDPDIRRGAVRGLVARSIHAKKIDEKYFVDMLLEGDTIVYEGFALGFWESVTAGEDAQAAFNVFNTVCDKLGDKAGPLRHAMYITARRSGVSADEASGFLA